MMLHEVTLVQMRSTKASLRSHGSREMTIHHVRLVNCGSVRSSEVTKGPIGSAEVT